MSFMKFITDTVCTALPEVLTVFLLQHEFKHLHTFTGSEAISENMLDNAQKETEIIANIFLTNANIH